MIQLKNASFNVYILVNGALLLAATLGLFYKFYKKKNLNFNKNKSKYSKYTVILHQYSRGLRAPSLSPYALKIETWLRIANFKYEVKLKLNFFFRLSTKYF